MRRKLACDAPEETRWSGLPEDDPVEVAGLFREVVTVWRRAGARVVLLDAGAQERLSNVAPNESMSAIVRSALALTLPPAGHTMVFTAYIAPERLIPLSDDLAPFDGAWVHVLTRPSKMIFIYGASTPEGFGVTTPVVINLPLWDYGLRQRETDPVARMMAAATAALLDPLWVRSVVVHTEKPTASNRARRRGDPRAAPVEVLRLAPTPAPHVVRYAEPVVVGPGPGARRRVGRGIVLGAPIAEHDVRGHVRRHPTTLAHAEERGWAIEEWTSLAFSDSPVVALVPVRPHIRGKGPRRTTVIRA